MNTGVGDMARKSRSPMKVKRRNVIAGKEGIELCFDGVYERVGT